MCGGEGCVCVRAHALAYICTYRGCIGQRCPAPNLVPLRCSLSLNLELAMPDRLLASQVQHFCLHHQVWYYRDV